MITLKTKGTFKNTFSFFEKAKHLFNSSILDKYGKIGVEELRKATPKESGLTSESWHYEIKISKDFAEITFLNTNIQNGYNVAIILQNGHATRGGHWVQGIDYINPALKPVFEELANNAFKEATR